MANVTPGALLPRKSVVNIFQQATANFLYFASRIALNSTYGIGLPLRLNADDDVCVMCCLLKISDLLL